MRMSRNSSSLVRESALESKLTEHVFKFRTNDGSDSSTKKSIISLKEISKISSCSSLLDVGSSSRNIKNINVFFNEKLFKLCLFEIYIIAKK